jgi:hypothetical protein
MAPAPTVEGRLICACNCAYDISQTGQLPTGPTTRYYVGAGFLSTPAAFVDPTGIHAGLVGNTPDGVVLALRGTLTFNFQDRLSLRDWLNDFATALVRPDWLPADSGARVHDGFLSALEALVVQGAQTEVTNRLQAAGAGTKLLITGHSKGGGVAPLAAMRLWKTAAFPSQVVTFAAPHAGNPAFADLYGNASIVHTRYEFQDDIVPHVPPTIGGVLAQLESVPWIGNLLPGLLQFDYEPVGELRFIDWSNDIVADSKPLQLHRLAHLVEIILTEQWDVFRLDHQISCEAKGGYIPVVCPAGVCAP